MTPEDTFTEHVGLALETFQLAAETLTDPLIQASDALTQSLLSEGKILVCGMGSSGATGSGFCERMMSRFQRERPSFPVMSLNTDGLITSSIAQHFGHSEMYARQIRTLASTPDVLIVISATGTASALIKAVQAAHEQDIQVIALTGHNGGSVASVLRDTDIELRVESGNINSIQLTHHLLLGSLVELIEHSIFGMDL